MSTAQMMITIRILRDVLNMTEADLYRKVGPSWKSWSAHHLARLEEYVENRKKKLYAYEDKRAEDFIDILDELIADIYRHRGSEEKFLRAILKTPKTSKQVRALTEQRGFVFRDVNKTATRIGVKRTREVGKRGGKLTIWSLR